MARTRSYKHYSVGAIQFLISLLLLCNYSVAFGFESKENRKLRRGDLMKEKALTQTWRNFGRGLTPVGDGGGKSGGKSGGTSGSGSGGTSGSGSSGSGVGWTSGGYFGCLTLSSEELYDTWSYPGSVPGCDYVSHNGDGSTTVVTAQSGSSSSSSSTGASSQSRSSSSSSSAGNSPQSSSSSSGSSAGTSSKSSSSYSTVSPSSSSQTSSYNDASASGSSQTSSYNGASASGSSQSSSYNAASAADSSQGSSSYNDSSNSAQSSSSNNQGGGEYDYDASNSNQGDGAYEADGDGDGDSNAQAQSYASDSEGNDQSDATNGYNYNDGDGAQVNCDDSDGGDEAYDQNDQGEQENQGDYGNTQGTYASDFTDPYLVFAIKQCDSYNKLWFMDLVISCDDIEKSTENCICTFTEQLIEKELLTCDDAADCPAGCDICSTCLFLAGCSDVTAAGSIFAQGSTSGTFAAAFALAVLLGVLCFTFKQKRRRRDGSGLGKHLMDDESGGKVWLVPIDCGESDKSGKQVTDSSMDAERGVVTKVEKISESRNHKLNNHTNSMERSMRKLGPKSADEQTAKDVSGMVGGFFARRGREYRRRQKQGEKSQDKEVEGDDEFSGSVFPDVLADLSMCDEERRRPTSVNKKNQEKPSPKNDTVAEENQKTLGKEASQESRTDRFLFPDLLAANVPKNVPKKASKESPPRQSQKIECTVASQETSVVHTEPIDKEEVQSMGRDDSSSSKEESTIILPPYNNDMSNSEPQLVDGLWLVPIDLNKFDENTSLGRSHSSNQEDDDETSINTEDSTMCSSITDTDSYLHVAEVTKLALSPMAERRQPSNL